MSMTPSERLKRNATSVATTVVTGVWLAALFTGQGWWLGALLAGYIVVVPVVSMVFNDGGEQEGRTEDERVHASERWEDGWFGGGWTAEETATEPPETDTRDALDTLRDRYARGDLTDEQFERKVEQLLETGSLEDAEERRRVRERLRE